MGSTSILAAAMRVWSLSAWYSKSAGSREIVEDSEGVAYGDLNTVIGQDEGSVGGSELGGGHFDGWVKRCLSVFCEGNRRTSSRG